MSNIIQAIDIHNHRLTPMEAELWITVALDHVNATTEIRGRLLGPRCALATTVEVAYPLRPLSRKADNPSSLLLGASIPEPSLWEPECPFYYTGRVELWENGECVEVREFRHELRPR